MNVAAIVIEKKVMKPTDWETHPSKHVRKAYPTFAGPLTQLETYSHILGTLSSLSFAPHAAAKSVQSLKFGHSLSF